MQEVRKQVNLTIGERQIAELKAMNQKGVKIGEMAAALGLTYNKLYQNMRLLGMVKEIKDGSKPPSRRKLTPAEEKFHDLWTGRVDICNSFEEVIKVLNIKS